MLLRPFLLSLYSSFVNCFCTSANLRISLSVLYTMMSVPFIVCFCSFLVETLSRFIPFDSELFLDSTTPLFSSSSSENSECISSSEVTKALAIGIACFFTICSLRMDMLPRPLMRCNNLLFGSRASSTDVITAFVVFGGLPFLIVCCLRTDTLPRPLIRSDRVLFELFGGEKSLPSPATLSTGRKTSS